MAYVAFNRSFGNDTSSHMWVKNGFRMSPFIKSQKTDQNYVMSDYLFLEGNLPPSPSTPRAGGSLWGEYILPQSTLNSNAYARAYDKFKSKAYTQAASLTAIVERAKTFEMVSLRLKHLYDGAVLLKKGMFLSFLDHFGLTVKPKHRKVKWNRPRQFGSLWLEYWMGWAPTVGDVYSALEFLGKPIPDSPIRAGSSVPVSARKVNTLSLSRAITEIDGRESVWLKAKVVITNQTLYDLQGLGLANPLKTVWETTPFSWFVDWFTNVGQVLGQLTDWVGLQLKDLVVSGKSQITSRWSCTNWHHLVGGSLEHAYRRRVLTEFSRKCGGVLPTVRPIVRVPSGLSLSRGATLASLLVTMFSPKK